MRRHFQSFRKCGVRIKGFGGGPFRWNGVRKPPEDRAPVLGRSHWRRGAFVLVAFVWGFIIWLLVYRCC